MAAATRCDQGMTEMLEMADLVIREFKKEHPYHSVHPLPSFLLGGGGGG